MIHIAHLEALEEKLRALPPRDLTYRGFSDQDNIQSETETLIQRHISGLPEELQNRIWSEFIGEGPLTELLKDEQISEVIVNGAHSIWFEKNGRLHPHSDRFVSSSSYENFLHRLSAQSRTHLNLERPMMDGKYKDFRLHLAGSELTHAAPALTLRRHPRNPWSFARLESLGWGNTELLQTLAKMLAERDNFLIVGGTGCGKTSVLNACLQALPATERVILIEDTEELSLPNLASTRLLSRQDAQGLLPKIDLMELVRQSLRMRPDRLVLGEVRGPEAKDLLMALSTGHSGSLATLHASDPHQALLRLEMLVQLGAPMWALSAIRNLIFLSLQKIVVLQRLPGGRRGLEGIYRLCSCESSGILIEKTGR